MKNKVIYSGMAALILFSVMVSVISEKGEPADDLLRENVEALADNEYGHNIYCLGYGSLDCPLNDRKVKVITGEY